MNDFKMEMKKEKISLIEMIGAVSIITDHVFEKDENGNYINYMPELFDYATRLAFASTFCDYEPSGDYDKDYDEMMDFNIDDIIYTATYFREILLFKCQA